MALEAIQAQAGHRSIESTRIYLHLANDWLAGEYRRASRPSTALNAVPRHDRRTSSCRRADRDLTAAYVDATPSRDARTGRRHCAAVHGRVRRPAGGGGPARWPSGWPRRQQARAFAHFADGARRWRSAVDAELRGGRCVAMGTDMSATAIPAQRPGSGCRHRSRRLRPARGRQACGPSSRRSA